MSNVNINQLPVAIGLDGSEYFPLTQGGTTKRCAVGTLENFFTSGGFQSANTVLAGPISGAAAPPAFRALVSDDLPVVPVTKGGTGLTALGGGVSDWLADPSASNLRAATAGAGGAATGTVNLVFSNNPQLETPTFLTAAFCPTLIGGTGTGSTLALRSTSGVGATDAIVAQVGDNGATEAWRTTSAGNTGFGTSTPGQRVELEQAGSWPNLRLRKTGGTYWDLGGKSGNSFDITLAGGTPTLSIDTSNFIGIFGQTAPQAPLHVGLSNATPLASPAILVAMNRNGPGSGHGVSDESVVLATANGTGYAAYDADVTLNGTARHYDHYVAFQANLQYWSTGTLSYAYGLSVGLHFRDGLTTNFYGTYIYNPPVTGSASVVNAYGHYIEDMTSGTTLNYSIYTAGTSHSYFGGAVGFGAETVSTTFTPQVQIKKAGTDSVDPAMSLILNRQNSNTACFLFGVDSTNNAAISINGAGDFRIGINASGNKTFTENVRVTSDGNVKIGGTAFRGTTEGSKQLVLFNGTAPAGTLSNGVSFYSAAGEARVMDAAGNSTLLSPHDQETNEWIYHSIDTRTGKGLRIDMERMMRAINENFGWDFVKDFEVEPV